VEMLLMAWSNRTAAAWAVVLLILPVAVGWDKGSDGPRETASEAAGRRPVGGAALRLSHPAVSRVLENMPVNSGKRCLGIAAVAEALLHGREIKGNGHDLPEELARRVYGRLAAGGQVRYHARVLLGGRPVPIESTEAMDRLGTLVANLYKQDYFRLLRTQQGRRRLIRAQDSVLTTRKQLDGVLDAAPDKTAFFCAGGTRWFPDGRVESTHHAVLLRRGADGRHFVYDPNDPGSPIACRLSDNEKDLVVAWTCHYRDTGLVTTQRYRLVPAGRFFQLALGKGKPAGGIKSSGDGLQLRDLGKAAGKRKPGRPAGANGRKKGMPLPPDGA
jgi:hypothetical protein